MATLQSLIDKAGGLHSRAGLARRWGVKRQYITEVTARPDFPAPATEVDGHRGHVWTGNDADAWRAASRKPGPKA